MDFLIWQDTLCRLQMELDSVDTLNVFSMITRSKLKKVSWIWWAIISWQVKRSKPAISSATRFVIDKYLKSSWMAPLRKANKPIYFSKRLIQTRMPQGRLCLKNRSKISLLPIEKRVLLNLFSCCLKSLGPSIPQFNNILDQKTTMTTAMALLNEA